MQTCKKQPECAQPEVSSRCRSRPPSSCRHKSTFPRANLQISSLALLHHGQICFSTERIIVHAAVAEEFQTHLLEAVSNHTTNGTAVTPGIAQHAHDVLQDAQANGSTLLVGKGEWDDSPFNKSDDNKVSLRPTIVLNPKNRIVDEETFGPSASLYIIENDEQAIALANRSSYGLNATIHSSNMERALKMARELEYGQVHVNSISVYTSRKSSLT